MNQDTPNDHSVDHTGDGTEHEVIIASKEYLKLLELNQAPTVEQFCEQHGNIASSLKPALEGMLMLHRNGAGPSKVVHDTLGAESSSLDREVPGKPIGDFQIICELGRGGMGVVYEAIQLSLNRRVALKVLPFASGLDKVRLQRFRNEAHAAAGLHHSNIVPVYAVGSERGVHYYAMQLIDGHTLAELIDRMRASRTYALHRSEKNPPASNTPELSVDKKLVSGSVRELDETFRQASTTLLRSSSSQIHYFESVVEMAVQAAVALQYAHQYGIIHRDIKPGNLLLDQSGKVWVTDFGLAQIQHADGQLTRSGDHIGTLRYMSPEQALGNRGLLDHRCDIYSLGVTLYELLTLRPAVEGENYRQMLNQVAEHEPAAPRSINPAIPLDLDTILRKAIAKEPAQRYATAQALADDLQRWLDSKPIEAKPPTIWQRVAKWRRRNSLLVNTAGLLLGLLSMGLLVTTMIVLREQRATKQALHNEIQQRNIAEQNFQQARTAVDTFSELSESELAFRPEVQTLRRKILEASLEFYRGFLSQRKDDPEMSQELMSASAKAEKILEELALIQQSSLYSLLDDPRVLADLKMDEAQIVALEQYLFAFHNDLMAQADWGELNYAANTPSSIERTKQYVEVVRSILTSDQNARLKQIAYQFQLPFTFMSDDVVEQLELTSAQRQLINNIIMDHGPDRHRKEGRGPQPSGMEPRRGLQFQDFAGPNDRWSRRGPGGPEHRRSDPEPRRPGPERPGADGPGPFGVGAPGRLGGPDNLYPGVSRPGPGPDLGNLGGRGGNHRDGSGFSGPRDPKMTQIRAETVEHILRDALDAHQRETWAAMIGPPLAQ